MSNCFYKANKRLLFLKNFILGKAEIFCEEIVKLIHEVDEDYSGIILSCY